MTRRLAPLALAAAVLALPACDSGEVTVPLSAETETVAAPAADTARYALQFLEPIPENVVTADPPSIVPVGADSAQTTFWEVAFRGAEVFLNSGESGPGAAVGYVTDIPFEDVTRADTLAVPFRRDGESACPDGPARVVCPPGDSPFALFRPTADGVEPIPGRTLVLRLADAAGFAKLRIDALDAEAGTVTVEYLVNPTGADLRAGTEVTLDR